MGEALKSSSGETQQTRTIDPRVALTALCVAAGDFTTVGDENGWIILPPRAFIQRWAIDSGANAGEEPTRALHVEP